MMKKPTEHGAFLAHLLRAQIKHSRSLDPKNTRLAYESSEISEIADALDALVAQVRQLQAELVEADSAFIDGISTP